MKRTGLEAADIAGARMRAQQLDATSSATAADVVRQLGAVQSQDYPLALWSIAQRLEGGTQRDVTAAVAEGSILRTHILRPTWHFVARDDLRWMLQLTAPHVLAKISVYDRRHGVDEALVTTSRKIITDAIARAGHLTRAEIAAALARRRVKADDGWLIGHLLMHAELIGAICSGAPRGGQQTYALLDERAPKATVLAGDEALAELARRYFTSHAPATLADFRWWSGLAAAKAARAVASLDGTFERVAFNDVTLLVDRTASSASRTRGSGGAHILQAFDELVVAYSQTRDLLDQRGLLRQCKPEGLLTRAVVLNRQAIGRWRRVTSGTSSVLQVELAAPVSTPGRKAIARAADRFARFLERPVSLEFVDPSATPGRPRRADQR